MPYSKDGRHFNSILRRDKYERSLQEDQGLVDKGRDDFKHAPSADPIKESAEHGMVIEHSYKVLGNGQHQIKIKYADFPETGFEHESVHPEAFRAFDLLTKAHGFEEKPPAIKTHMRARSHPVGPKEDERLAREDHREVPSEPPEETEE